MTHRVAPVLVVCTIFLAGGCAKSEKGAEESKVTESAATIEATADATTPITTPPASTTMATAAPAPAAAGAVIASETFSANPNLRADLLEVRRVSGGALLVKWRIVNTSPATESKPIYYDFSWDNDLYYVDPAENKKYEYLKDSEGNRILDVFWGSIKTGETRANWAKFPAPPATSTKISLTLPKFPPFEDVPVAP